MLVFNTYLLISGHIRGHGSGHFGHGGQYTALGHAFGLGEQVDGALVLLALLVLSVLLVLLLSCALDEVGVGSVGLVVATTMVGGSVGGGVGAGGVLMTRTHLGVLSMLSVLSWLLSAFAGPVDEAKVS